MADFGVSRKTFDRRLSSNFEHAFMREVTYASAYMATGSRIQIVVENTPYGISTRSLATPVGWTNSCELEPTTIGFGEVTDAS